MTKAKRPNLKKGKPNPAAKAENIAKGDWIKNGRHNGKVKRVSQPDVDRVEIDWSRGSKSGVLGRKPDAKVKRVYKAKRTWHW